MQRIQANNVSLLESVNQSFLLHATLKKYFESVAKRVGELEHKLESISTHHSSANTENISKMPIIIDDLKSKVPKSNSEVVLTHEKDLAKIQD